jgi:hypothetical protein
VWICFSVGLVSVIGFRMRQKAEKERHAEYQFHLASAEFDRGAAVCADLDRAINCGDLPLFQSTLDRVKHERTSGQIVGLCMDHAASLGRTRQLDYALDHLFSPARARRWQDGGLAIAVAHRHADTVRMLLARNAHPNTERYSVSPLDDVAGAPAGDRCSLEIARMLLHAGADVNAPITSRDSPVARIEYFSYTPLMLAARAGNADMVKLLLNAHANTAARNAHGEDAAAVAERCGRPAIAQIIRTAGNGSGKRAG